MDNTNDEDNLEINIIDSIAADNLAQIGTDLGEIALDVILKNGVLKDIPVFGTLYKLANAGMSIRDKIFVKKVYRFLFEIKDIPTSKRADFAVELEQYERSRQSAGETILILLDRLNHLQKPQILGRLLKAKILGKIDLETFMRLSNAVEGAYFHDLFKVKDYDEEVNPDNHHNPHKPYISNGLLTNGFIEETEMPRDPPSLTDPYFKISDLGKLIIKYGLSD